jgi:hypothetical protein
MNAAAVWVVERQLPMRSDWLPVNYLPVASKFIHSESVLHGDC